MIGKHKQTSIQTSGNDKLFSEFLSESGRDDQSAFGINCMIVFTHEHRTHLLSCCSVSMVISLHFNPLYTTFHHLCVNNIPKSIKRQVFLSVIFHFFLCALSVFHRHMSPTARTWQEKYRHGKTMPVHFSLYYFTFTAFAFFAGLYVFLFTVMIR